MSYFKLPMVFLSEMVSGKADSTNEYIASWLIQNKSDLRNLSIRELASKMNTSASSISRFCRDIGLHDYNELKDLSERNDTQFKKYCSDLPPDEQKNDITSKVISCLELVRDSVDMDKVVRLANDILCYDRVAVFGVGKAEGVAMNLQIDLIAQGKYVVTKLPFAEQTDYLECTNESDLIIIFSFQGVYFEYGFPERILKSGKNKPKIYFITSDSNAASSKLYDEVIWFQSDRKYTSHPYQMQLIADLISQQYADLLG